MAKVRALVLTGFGINCDAETQTAFERAGAEAARVHLNDLIERPALLNEFHILAVPGGFSFGDDVASGKILANRLRYALGDPIRAFLDAGKLMIGICNGFQVLVKMGALPRLSGGFQQEVTLTHNDSGRFEDRWVRLVAAPGQRCVWTQGIETIELPIRHGEGKFIPANEATLDAIKAGGMLVFRYADWTGAPARGVYPANPNGSVDDVAAICDATGRVFGLMPHPEAFIESTNHPEWTRRDDLPAEGAGLALFQNAVRYAEKTL